MFGGGQRMAMPALFDPSRFPASAGDALEVPTLGTTLDPDDPGYVTEVTFSLNFARFYNASYRHKDMR